jgi:hypothetical protein
MKGAMIEYGWLFHSDVCNAMSDTVRAFDMLTAAEREVQREKFRSIGEKYLRRYIDVTMGKCLGVTHAFHAWFLEQGYPILEELLSRCENREKTRREQMHRELASMLPDLSLQLKGQIDGDLLLRLLAYLPDSKRFLMGGRPDSMLTVLYYVSLICDLVRDVAPAGS